MQQGVILTQCSAFAPTKWHRHTANQVRVLTHTPKDFLYRESAKQAKTSAGFLEVLWRYEQIKGAKMNPYVIILLIVVVVGIILYLGRQRVVIFDYETGVLFVNGKFKQLLEPGLHTTFFQRNRKVIKVDMRSQALSIQGQEIISADNVGIRISLGIIFRVSDAYKATTASVKYLDELYLLVQTELRDIVGGTPIDLLLQKRKEINEELFEAVRTPVAELGLKVKSIAIKDITFPGELRGMFAQVVNAKNEGLAALERARGESAALRNLANTAKLMENNPSLYQLRLLQALEKGRGNTVILSPNPDLAGMITADKKSGQG